MSILQSPRSAKDLPASAEQWKDLDPEGLLAPCLGQRYDLEALRQTENYSYSDEPYLPRIRAFPVPVLINSKIVIHRDMELAIATKTLLLEKLPPFDWDIRDISVAPLRKYCILHTCLPAPDDLATRQPMALEIFGEILSVDGVNIDFDSEEGQQWRHQQTERFIEAYRQHRSLPELKGEIILEIQVATYSNIQYLGLGVPLYL